MLNVRATYKWNNSPLKYTYITFIPEAPSVDFLGNVCYFLKEMCNWKDYQNKSVNAMNKFDFLITFVEYRNIMHFYCWILFQLVQENPRKTYYIYLQQCKWFPRFPLCISNKSCIEYFICLDIFRIATTGFHYQGKYCIPERAIITQIFMWSLFIT